MAVLCKQHKQQRALGPAESRKGVATLALTAPVPRANDAEPDRQQGHLLIATGIGFRGEIAGRERLAIQGAMEGVITGCRHIAIADVPDLCVGALTADEKLFIARTARVFGALAEEAARGSAADDEAALASVDALLESASAVEDSAALAEAEATFRVALEANLCDIAALSGLGHLARQRGDLAGALHYFGLIMAADARNVSVRCVILDILRALSRHDEAAAIAKEVLALRTQHAQTGEDDTRDACAPPSSFDEAEAMFESVVDRHPTNVGALAGLGHLARRRGDRETMQRYYLAALAVEPTNATLRVDVARAFKEQGDVARARQILATVPSEQR